MNINTLVMAVSLPVSTPTVVAPITEQPAATQAVTLHPLVTGLHVQVAVAPDRANCVAVRDLPLIREMVAAEGAAMANALRVMGKVAIIINQDSCAG